MKLAQHSNAAFFFTLILMVVAGCFVYIGVPVWFWRAMEPVLFWQKLATIVGIAVYEYCTFWIGFLLLAGIIAVLG